MSDAERSETPPPVGRAVRRRAVLAVGPPCAVTALAAALPVILRDRLPADPTWSNRSGLALFGLVVALAAAGFMLWRRPYMVGRSAAAVSVGWVAGALIAGWLVGGVLVNLDRSGIVTDPAGWWTSTPAVVAATVAAYLLGWRAAGPDPLPDPVRPARWRAPRTPTPPAWTHSYAGRDDLAAAACLGGTAAVRLLLPWGHNPTIGVTSAAVGVWFLARSRLRLEVDEEGLRLVRPLLLRRCLLEVARGDVASAAVAPLTAASLPDLSHGVFWRGTRSGYRERTTGAVVCVALTTQDTVMVTGPVGLAGDRLPWPASPSPATRKGSS